MADWVQPYAPVFDPQGDTTSQMLDKLNKNQVDVYTKLNRVRKLDAGDTAPSDPIDNHLWFSLNDYALKRWNGTSWARAGVIAVSNEAELINAITNIGTDEAVVLIGEPIKLTADLTIPENMQLKFLKGAYIDSDTAVGTFTLTINGSIDAGLYRIFGDNLTVVGSPKVEVVYPEWFGAAGDGVNDDTVAVSRAKSLCEYDGDFKVAQRVPYLLLTSQYLVSGIDLFNKITIKGVNKFTSGLVVASGGYGIKLTATQTQNFYAMGFILENFFIKDSGGALYGIVTDETVGIQSSLFDNLYIDGFTIGIYFKGGWINTFKDIDIFNSGVGILMRTLSSSVACNQNLLQNVRVQGFKRIGILLNARATQLINCTVQIDAYDATYTVSELPAGIVDGGIVIYKSDGTDGYAHTDVSENIIEKCWFETLTNWAIVIQGINDTYRPKNNIIFGVSASSNITKAIYLQYAYETKVHYANFYSSTAEIQMTLSAWKTAIIDSNIAVVNTDNVNYYNQITNYGGRVAIKSPVSITLSPNSAGSYYITEGSAGLNASGVFAADNLGTGGSSDVNGTLGNVVKSMPIYDKNGNILGYIPIYDSIT